ncbi:MAG: 30S ribosomal protein S12 methylthiotransferase RimO [Corallococcus sp.]|nr:30S ribosomal protein S12 methylthiotransferase RimO [Corallococcus sp.]MCM1394546.1 30S ribosomal protein S12 methylthiotransferase RimO [Corallococcus sp.]
MNAQSLKSTTNIKIGVISLGCDKNRLDTEMMLANLQAGGYQITSDAKDADVIIVNTCAFLQSARQEAIDTVLEMSHLKQLGRCKKIIVTGCLGQKFGQEVLDGLTEADAVVGTNEYQSICQIVQNTLEGERKLYNGSNPCMQISERILTTPKHYAYLKIADGCNNFCSYCLIPYIRGRFRSVPQDQLVLQAKQLAECGVRELILVAQDTTKYGTDIYGEPRLVQLIKDLSAIDGLHWIRLLYCYPELCTEELITEIECNPKVAKYIDIPLQHVDDGILKAMNRKSNRAGVDKLFARLAKTEPKIEVRSTFICGFPGETEQTVIGIQDFLQRNRLRNVGFFAYSQEDGTAAAKLPNQVSQRAKQKYVKQMYKTQYKIMQKLSLGDVGKIYECVIDEFVEQDGQTFVYRGRTQFMAPEIDGVVYVHSAKPIEMGQFVNVKITNSLDYDLIGEVI